MNVTRPEHPLSQDLQGKGERRQDQARKIKDFFTALALCHTVIPERFEDTDEVCSVPSRSFSQLLAKNYWHLRYMYTITQTISPGIKQ